MIEAQIFLESLPDNNKHLLVDTFGGARGVMVIVAEIGHGNTSSNPGRDWLHFT